MAEIILSTQKQQHKAQIESLKFSKVKGSKEGFLIIKWSNDQEDFLQENQILVYNKLVDEFNKKLDQMLKADEQK